MSAWTVVLSAVGADSTRVVHVGARAPVDVGYTCARGLRYCRAPAL